MIVEHNVPRFDVTVNHAPAVSVVERSGDLFQHPRYFGGRGQR